MTFNIDKARDLKKQYDQAVKDEKTSFLFDGHELLTSFAKYMIEYLETKFGKL